MAKAQVNFQHKGVWYGPDHGNAEVPADVVKEVGAHVLENGPVPAEIEENSEQADKPPRKTASAKKD